MIEVKKTDKLVFDLKMRQVDYNEQKKEALRKEIADKYGVDVSNVEINFTPITVNKEGKKVSLASDIVESIQDPKFQQKLFAEYLDAKEDFEYNIDDIIAIDEQVNAFVDFDSYSKFKSYKFKYAKWDNYLSYGKNNYFDFTKLNGLVLLNGQPENQCGKTTFAIDLLRFALFGKSHKSPKLDKVFNIYRPEETEAMVEVCIEIDGVDYVIRRTITRPPLKKRTKKSKCKQKVEYFKLVNGSYELIENCEGENNTETNNIIRDSVGGVDDYNLVISATAKTLGDLFELGQTDRGELFSRWLGLQTIEKKAEIAKEMWKKNINPTLLSNKYDKATLEEDNKSYLNVIEENKNEISARQEVLNGCNEKINKLNEDKVNVLTGIKEIKDGLDKLDVNTLNMQYQSMTDELQIRRGAMKRHKEEYMAVKGSVFNEDELKSCNQRIDELNAKKNSLMVSNAELKTKISVCKDEIKRVESLISGGKCPTCGQEINVGEQNTHIEEQNERIKSLIEQGVKNKGEIDGIDSELADVRKKIEELEVIRDNVRKKNELELKMTAVKSNIDNLKLKMEDITRKLSEISTNEENIRHNNEIRLKVSTIDETIKVEQSVKENAIREIEAYKAENKKFNEEIEKRKTVISTLIKEEKIIRNWSIYQELVGKNGIVKIVLRRALPILNNEISRLLNGLCDFDVEISVSDENLVCMDIVRKGQKLDVGISASGFEMVMASLAVRHALSCIATLSKPNFTVYDEVLGGVGVSNYDNVRTLFERMAKSYDFILHITHNEIIGDWHSNTITVTKDADGNSIIGKK